MFKDLQDYGLGHKGLMVGVNSYDIDSDSTYDDSFECFKMIQIRDLHQKKRELRCKVYLSLSPSIIS
jgi:hypothetical protein